MIPTIETERLRLVAPTMAHWPAYRDFHASERSRSVGGPMGERWAFAAFGADVGHWALHGTGYWAVEMEGEPAGHVGVWHPPWHAEHEIAWTVWEGFEGRGVAFEAAGAAREWARAHDPRAPLVSYVAEGNDRSARLAERLGARPDGPAAHAPGVVVWRHPEAAA